MSQTHESPSHKGSFTRCANLQGIKSPAVSSRGLWLPAGAGGEQVDGWQGGESRAAAVGSLGIKQCGCRYFSSPSTPEWRTLLPALSRQEELVPLGLSRGAEGRAETQANTLWVLLPLAAFAHSPPSLSHKDFNCSHGQQFCLGRHPALPNRSKMTPHTFLKVWKKQPSWIVSPPSGY